MKLLERCFPYFLAAAVLVGFYFMIIPPSGPQISFERVTENPNAYVGKKNVFTDGVVLYRAGRTLIIAPLADVKKRKIDSLHAIAVWFSTTGPGFRKLKPGDVIYVFGSVVKTSEEYNERGNATYYIFLNNSMGLDWDATGEMYTPEVTAVSAEIGRQTRTGNFNAMLWAATL